MKNVRILLGTLLLLSASVLYAQDLPLTHLQLFSSGVGYFERSGKVTDNATVQLSFRTEEVNDLLKSMVLFDLDGGKIGAVNYGTQDPISKTLGSYAININDNPSMGKLLDRLRGVSVEIDASKKMTGKIIGVEVKQKNIGENVVNIEQLNLITSTGIKSVNLDEISSLKILDERLNKELQNALTTLASGLDNQRKPVSISFLGKGERRVAVGYIEKTPIWKTSYRVVMGEKDSTMQGWAIVENTSDADWNGVKLSLVSGRPISFMQDLYTPLYLQRPMVQSQLYASIRPVTYAGGVPTEDEPAPEIMADMAAPKAEMNGVDGKNNFQAFNAYQGNRLNASMPPGKSGYQSFGSGNALKSGVESAVNATNLGEAFSYDILEPVTLARQQSALLPILNSPVQTSKVSIYNNAVHPSYPVYGLKLKNNTGINLMGGPVTVYDGSTYAGDATFEDLNPGEERLVSYALDLGVTCLKDVDTNSTRLAVGIKDGQWKSSWKRQQITTYTFLAKDGRDRNMLVEHHITRDYKLIEPEKAAETTEDLYRFNVAAKAKTSVKLKVVEEKTDFTYEGISNQSIDWMLSYSSDKAVSDKVKDALKQIVEMKKNIDTLRQTQQDNRVSRQQIVDEQNRIRQNMNSLDRNSDLYKRYVTKFNEQETKMENLLESDEAALVKLRAAEKAMSDFLTKLTVE